MNSKYIVTFTDGEFVHVFAPSSNQAGQLAIIERFGDDDDDETPMPPIRSIAQL
jgi:hypothetical protein